MKESLRTSEKLPRKIFFIEEEVEGCYLTTLKEKEKIIEAQSKLHPDNSSNIYRLVLKVSIVLQLTMCAGRELHRVTILWKRNVLILPIEKFDL